MVVSVIIPFYNAEKTLDMLYQSICKQTYQNLDIIFVDNGSTDRGNELIQRYQMLDPRIQLLHEEKKGVSYARKKGFHHAKGEYVYFVDADDYVAPTAVESLLNAAMFHQADVVQGGFQYIWNINQEIRQSEISDPALAMDISNDNPNHLYDQRAGLWIHLYRKDLIRDEFFVNLTQEEDSIFMFYIYAYANKIVRIPDIVYYYIKCNNQLSKIENYDGSYPLLNELGKVFQCYQEQDLFTSCQHQLEGRILKLYFWKYHHILLELCMHENVKYMKMFLQELQDIIPLFHLEKHPGMFADPKLQSTIGHFIENSIAKQKR